MTHLDGMKAALEVFERLQRAFPHLRMELDLEHPELDASVDIPRQEGLDFDVHLNLQNADELHLSAGPLWVEWFPCTDPYQAEVYFRAVSGLLSGDYRILEHRRGARVLKAELQRPEGSGWRTVGTWSTLSLPWGRKSVSVLRNRSARGAGS